MPKLGSRFFDSYNGQIDRLRRRRSENVEAFNSFVKMRQENGEVASVAEMEKYRNSLAGGDQYFMNAMPTSEMIKETRKAMVANQADLQETRRQNALKTSQDELSLVTQIASTVIDQDFNDTSEGGGRSKIANAFETSGNGQLFAEYGDMMPNIMDTARTERTQQWIVANGFDKVTTTEGKEALIANAPAWMKSTLNTQGDLLIERSNQAKIKAAIDEVQRDLAGIINDAGGDQAAVEKAIKGRLRQKLGALYSDKIFATLSEIAEGEVALDLSKRTGDALANVTVDNDLLVGARGNPSALRDLAKQALIRAGLKNPTEDDIDNAVAQLQQQQKGALRQDFETKLDVATTMAESMTSKEAALIDGDEEIDATVERILSGAYKNFEKLSDDEKAEARARVRSIIANKSGLANEAEQVEDDEYIAEQLRKDPVLLNLYQMGPVAEKMDTIYDNINTMRAERGLPKLSREALEAKYGATVNAMMRVGASQRYAKEEAEAVKLATDSWDALTSGHQKEMERVASSLGDDSPWAQIVNIAETRWVPRTSAGYRQFQDALIAMAEKEPPRTPQEAAQLADKLAQSLGWLPAGTGRSVMIAERLSDKDLIEPGTKAGDLVESESAILTGALGPAISQIELTNMDGDVSAIKSALLEQINAWEEGLINDINSPAVRPLLNDLGNYQAHMAAILAAAEKARQDIQNAQPQGQYSFMVFSPSPQGGHFLVSDDPSLRETVTRNGFKPGATYKKTESGEFVEILAPPVTNSSGQIEVPTEALNPTDVQSSALSNTVSQIMSDAEFEALLPNMAARIATGADGGDAASPLARGFNAIFGSVEKGQQLAIRANLIKWLQSDAARNALYGAANPQESAALLQENPTEWAVLNGWGG